MIGHARAGMGYRNEFQTENYGLLTNQTLFIYGVCSFSHVEHMSMLKFAHILVVIRNLTKNNLSEPIHPSTERNTVTQFPVLVKGVIFYSPTGRQGRRLDPTSQHLPG